MVAKVRRNSANIWPSTQGLIYFSTMLVIVILIESLPCYSFLLDKPIHSTHTYLPFAFYFCFRSQI